jgi:hypothetical protein
MAFKTRRIQDWLVSWIGPDLISDMDHSDLTRLINLLFLIDITRAVLLHHHYEINSPCCMREHA